MNDITAEELIERYAVILLDAFGVLAHSTGALPGATEFIAEMNRTGKPYYILTNDASTLPASRAERYRSFGLEIEADRIISSGALLSGYFEENNLDGASCVVLGTDDSISYVEAAGGHVVGPRDDFDILVIANQSGYPFIELVDATLSALYRKLDNGDELRLVLPNPDLVYPEADGFGFASGSVALMFESALALRYPNRDDLRFVRLGKPHPAIFSEALRRSGTKDMVMIGDQLETDIQGANAFGLDSVLIDTGVTVSSVEMAPEHLRPTFRMRSLLF